MKTFITILSAAAVAAASFAAALPANAAQPADAATFQLVANRPPVFQPHGSYAYYNGHRGDRHFHPGWRQYNGYWFPPAAFVGAAIGAAILGGIIAHSH